MEEIDEDGNAYLLEERKVHVTFFVKALAWRDGTGRIEGAGIDTIAHPPDHVDNDEALIRIEVELPVSLWEVPTLKGKVKSRLVQMIADFVEVENESEGI